MSASKKGMAGLVLGAVGVVFGDIGTSPLYAVQVVFGAAGQNTAINYLNVYGIISLILWSVTVVVSIKYLSFIMRADNKGEGGVVALVSIIKDSKITHNYKWLFIFIGLAGVALFYGDSAITPAISVLSAVEGLKVVIPSLSHLIVPVTLVILTFLFWMQKYGTNFIGRLFGPVMLVWFLAIGSGGAYRIWQNPDILKSLSPRFAIDLIIQKPLVAFIAMGAVTLAITGAEALYADMGHFGRRPISKAWFLLVFPALLLCYMGQGSLILHTPAAASSPFIFIFPESLRFSMVILATLATLIASQSVISGAFSLTRQAIQLDFLPKMRVLHTSARSIGQVYLPFINFVLFLAVAFLVVVFGSSEKLANAYGLAVSGTLAVDTILFIVVIGAIWRKPKPYVVFAGGIFLLIDLVFVTSNLTKILKGGWFPVLIAATVFLLIQTWIKGQKIVHRQRREMEGTLEEFVRKLHNAKPAITRVPGCAIYISHHPGFAPLALHATIEKLQELHEKVVVLSVEVSNLSHVPKKDRAVFDGLEYKDGISHLALTYGFHDLPNIPKTLSSLDRSNFELDFDPEQASYFVSLSKIVATSKPNISKWRKSLYCLLARNAISSSDYYKLPTDRTVEMRSLIEL